MLPLLTPIHRSERERARLKAQVAVAIYLGLLGVAACRTPEHQVEQPHAGPVVDVNNYTQSTPGCSLGGQGTKDRPWTGWDSCIASKIHWTAATTYSFRSGVYEYTTTPRWGQNSIRLVGEYGGNTILLYTGAGADVALFDANQCEPADECTNGITGMVLENLTFAGKASRNAYNGLRLRGVGHSTIHHVRIRDVGGVAVYLEGALANTFDTIRVSANESAFSVEPIVGIKLATYTMFHDIRGNDIPCNVNTFVTPIIEGLTSASAVGIQVDASSFGNTFLDGTVEAVCSNSAHGDCASGTGVGLLLAGDQNTFIGTDLEDNGIDASVSGNRNVFSNVSSGGRFVLAAGDSNAIYGGLYNQVQIESSATTTRLRDVVVRGLTDNGVVTQMVGMFTSAPAGPALKDTIPRQTLSFITTYPTERNDLLHGSYAFATSTSTALSSTTISPSATWRAVFIGSWANDWEGTSLALPDAFIEVTSSNPSVRVGCCTNLLLSISSSGQLEGTVIAQGPAAGSARHIVFTGSVFVSPSQFSSNVSSSSMTVTGGVTLGAVNARDLAATAPNGAIVYCSNCRIAHSCAAGGSGALAKRIAGAWVCN